MVLNWESTVRTWPSVDFLKAWNASWSWLNLVLLAMVVNLGSGFSKGGSGSRIPNVTSEMNWG